MTAVNQPVEALEAAPLRVLLIDDDNEVLSSVSRTIARLGGACLTAQGIAQVLETIQDWQPSHIILDLFMPGENGMAIVHALVEAGIDTPVILTSGGDKRLMEAVARSAKTHGLTISALLPKPFTRARLAATLGQPAHALMHNGSSLPHVPIRPFTIDEISAAIRQGDIRPALQPKVCCADRTLVGFEALARWYHPEQGTVGPDQFISCAEDAKLLPALTLSMVDQTLSWLARSRHSTCTIAFNIAPSLLKDDEFTTAFFAVSQRHGIASKRIVFEVTESTKLGDDIATLDRLTGLRLQGIGLSIDDFGIGYSSLLQLAHLPFGEIKIDKSFVASLAASQESRTIISSIVMLAKKLGMITVAEGVENEATFVALKAMGCNAVQGYHFARPLSLLDAERCSSVFDGAERAA